MSANDTALLTKLRTQFAAARGKEASRIAKAIVEGIESGLFTPAQVAGAFVAPYSQLVGRLRAAAKLGDDIDNLQGE